MKYKVEMVTWIDSTGRHSWETLPIPEKDLCLSCVSVGFVVGETNEVLMVSNSLADLDGPDEQAHLTMCIPKVCIKSRKTLRA